MKGDRPLSWCVPCSNQLSQVYYTFDFAQQLTLPHHSRQETRGSIIFHFNEQRPAFWCMFGRAIQLLNWWELYNWRGWFSMPRPQHSHIHATPCISWTLLRVFYNNIWMHVAEYFKCLINGDLNKNKYCIEDNSYWHKTTSTIEPNAPTPVPRKRLNILVEIGANRILDMSGNNMYFMLNSNVLTLRH